MMELLENAWFEWEKYKQGGKLLMVFFAALLFVWIYKKGTEHRGFCLYASVMAVCCVCPVTAVLLMAYQTRFYGYQWIWSLVPVTGVTAYGIVLLLAEQWSGANREKRKSALCVTVLLAVALLLSGGLGQTPGEDARGEVAAKRRQAYAVLKELQDTAGEGITLWAPADILAYAREYSGDIRLLYGRNMWDAALNAYSYDVYGEEIKDLYQKMEEWVASGGKAAPGTGTNAAVNRREYATCVSVAMDAGVNAIVLPDSMAWATVLEVAEMLGATPKEVEDYWVLYGRVD